jgi:hypothetical protein
MIHKHMRQLHLIKFEWNNICEDYLLSSIASIALAYISNPLHPGLEYPIQFFLIDIR